MARKYRYRNYPCNIVPDDKLWEVSGLDLITGGGGVLEWCWDKEDAKHVYQSMKASGEFKSLSYSLWQERKDQ